MVRNPQRCYCLIVAILVVLSLSMQSVVLASTVGTIQGSVKDQATGAAIAGVAVTASSASGKFSATTDAHGFYAITGVEADTYTLSFDHYGYTAGSITGVTVFADEIAYENITLSKTLKTIATVSTTSGAFNPSRTSDTYSVSATQIESIQGNQLNTSLKDLIATMPGVSFSNGQAPSIRGGRTDNVDYELDGVPMINAYSNENVNEYHMPGFGLESVQVSPGNEDASFGNSGVGTINSVPRRGSYPGTFDMIAGDGGGQFYHALALGWGTGDPNGRWSNYASYTASNTAPDYGGSVEQNSTLNGSYGTVALLENREFTNNFVLNFGRDHRFDVQYFTDIGYNKRAAGYGMGSTYDVTTGNGMPSGNPSNLRALCYATCNPVWTDYFGNTANNLASNPVPNGPPIYGCSTFTGSAIAYCPDWDGLNTQEFLEMTPLYPGQQNATQALLDRPYYQEFDNNAMQKVALDFRPNSSTSLSLSYYNSSSQHISDSISLYAFTSGDVWAEEGGHIAGLNLDGQHEFSQQHLLKFGLGTYQDHPSFDVISPLTTLFNPLFNGNYEYLDFIPQGQLCPGLIGSGTALPASEFSSTYNSDPTNFTNACGWIYTQPGFTGKSFVAPPSSVDTNNLNPTGGSFYVTDNYTPSSRFYANFGVRVDYRNEHLPTPQVNADCTTQYLPIVWGVNPISASNPTGNFDPATGLFNGKPMGPGNCPTATFEPLTSYENTPVIPQPRLQMSLLATKHDVIRASYGRTMRYPNYVYSDAGVSDAPYQFLDGLPTHLATSQLRPFQATNYTLNATDPGNYYTSNSVATDCGMTNYGIAVPCTSYAEQYYWNGWNGNFGRPLFPLAPITYNNFDVSLEHQLGAGWSAKLTQWYRRAYDLDVASEVINPYVAPHLNADGTKSYSYFGLESNAGLEMAHGLEFLLDHPQPWHGFTGFLSLEVQDVLQNIDPAGTPAGSSRDLTGSVNNEYNGVISSAAAAFGGLYRVSYVSPFTAAANVQYENKHGGWRVRTTWYYDDGYPTGQGTNVYQLINGVAANVPRSNDCQTGGASRFADPTDPGSCLAPNIAATLGTSEGAYANQELTKPNINAEATIEKDLGPGTLGFTVFNVFDEVYPGPTIPYGVDYGVSTPILSDSFNSNQGNGFDGSPSYGINPAYQPVATGVSGPLSGQGLQFVNGTTPNSKICSQCPYFHLPNGVGRNFYIYYRLRLGGSKP